MSRYLFAGLAATLLLSACHESQETPVSSSVEKIKPKVAIAPVIDNSKTNIAWSLSDEITYSIFYKLDQKNKFAMIDPQRTKSITRKLQSQNDPFGSDIKWVKKFFTTDDFVVFIEMLEHDENPNLTERCDNPQECSANLQITARVVVVDNRSELPEVILQEIVNDSHFIPRQFNKYNFHQVSWGTDEFFVSPIGMAHSQFIKELSTRIEDYISLAQD